jgi:hypothetical protein
LGAIDKVRIILSSHPSSVSLSKEQLERLAAEVKAQLENSSVPEILSSPVMGYSR